MRFRPRTPIKGRAKRSRSFSGAQLICRRVRCGKPAGRRISRDAAGVLHEATSDSLESAEPVRADKLVEHQPTCTEQLFWKTKPEATKQYVAAGAAASS